MPNKEQSLLNRENYIVPKGQERVVHYKIARVSESGEIVEKARVVKTDPKLFDTIIKRNLELQGYTVEILFHPDGKYTNVKIIDKSALLAEKDAYIAELEAKLAASKVKVEKESTEASDEPKNEVKKGGRPKKEA